MRELLKCQNEVAQSRPNPYYLRAYRDAEVYYWLHIVKWLFDDAKAHGVRVCLDIGCGYGTLALLCKRLMNCEVYCTDVVDTYLSPLLAERHGLVFEVNNIELDDFPWDLRFDSIIFTEVLEHLNFHPLPTLKRIRQLLTQTGRVYLSTPDAGQWGRVTKYYRRLEDMPYPTRGRPFVDDHVYQFNKQELLSVLWQAGFRVERLDYSPGVIYRHFNLTLLPA